MRCEKPCPVLAYRASPSLKSRASGVKKDTPNSTAAAEYVVDFLPKVKIEATIDDALVERVIEAIEGAAMHRKDRRRQIFVYDVEQVVRIRTGETEEAL